MTYDIVGILLGLRRIQNPGKDTRLDHVKVVRWTGDDSFGDERAMDISDKHLEYTVLSFTI
jgi:hypothetical protein